jgi:beta-N-acetylhexosaminidase
LLIGVDQEGGRVQRFHQDFSSLPPSRTYGRLYDRDSSAALALARQGGWLMAAELLAAGVDFSFAPVLDLDRGVSSVIGDRAFHRDPDAVAALGKAFVQGMRAAGMAAVGKHFPGHGGVAGDSHHEVPVDDRRYTDLLMEDAVPFERLISADLLPAVMPAHVIYSDVDEMPAGFSSRWLMEILRSRLGFKGAIFSDDLNMAGAGIAGDYQQRARAALAAGCDMVLICNNRPAALTLLETLTMDPNPASQVRLMRLHGAAATADWTELKNSRAWTSAAAAVADSDRTPELGLGDDAVQS